MLDEQLIEKLSAYADGELDARAAGEVERALAEDAGLRACLAQFRRLEEVAAALPVPAMPASAGEALWQAVRARTAGGDAGELTPAALRRVEAALDKPPVVAEDRWRQAWAHIQARTTGASARPLDADLTPGPMQAVEPRRSTYARERAAPIPLWRGFLALAAAAVVLIVATAVFLHQIETTTDRTVTPPPVRVAEALDDRYFVMVKHVPGIEQPVVCFFLKEPDPELEEIESWP